jgi:hypothetical protein
VTSGRMRTRVRRRRQLRRDVARSRRSRADPPRRGICATPRCCIASATGSSASTRSRCTSRRSMAACTFRPGTSAASSGAPTASRRTAFATAQSAMKERARVTSVNCDLSLRSDVYVRAESSNHTDVLWNPQPHLSNEACRTAPPDVTLLANARQSQSVYPRVYPRRSKARQSRQHIIPVCRDFMAKPLTDSNRRPPPYHGFRSRSNCHQLPAVAPARLHKRSIPSRTIPVRDLRSVATDRCPSKRTKRLFVGWSTKA